MITLTLEENTPAKDFQIKLNNNMQNMAGRYHQCIPNIISFKF